MKGIAVFGFGLIGGSIGLAARAARSFGPVTAIDAPDVLTLAREREAADIFVDRADSDAVARSLSEATLTVLATPVRVICDSLEFVLSYANVVTDCGSTKRQIVESARRSARARRFVPGHPMAGLPHGGLKSARADLFRDSAWLLCPQEAEADAVALVETLIAGLGARAIALEPAEHDAAVARTSHVPQLLASALAVLGERYARTGAAGPAFERATRAAGGPAPVWQDIFSSNADEIARALRELCGELEAITGELGEGGEPTLTLALLDRARHVRS